MNLSPEMAPEMVLLFLPGVIAVRLVVRFDQTEQRRQLLCCMPEIKMSIRSGSKLQTNYNPKRVRVACEDALSDSLTTS